MRTFYISVQFNNILQRVGMKPLSERDENTLAKSILLISIFTVGMKPLSERDENGLWLNLFYSYPYLQ